MSKSCRGEPQTEPGFIVMLFDYTQVKWKVYLHPLKITFSFRKLACTGVCDCFVQRENTADKWGYLCHLSWTLIFSISLQFHLSSDNTQQKKMLTEKLYVCMLDYILSHLPDTPISAALLVLGQFFDDRQWQSWVELHGSCLSSGCSVWCTFDVVQAHCRPRLWLLAYDTKLRQSWNLEGRKEGSTLPRQSTQFEKQQPVITQSVLIHCPIVQGFRCFVFDGFQKKKRRINV